MCTGKVAAGALLVALGYTDCTQPAVAIALLVLAVSIAGFQYSGFLVNHVDIAPQYAGILFGISNSIAAITGFISPVVVGVITEEVNIVLVSSRRGKYSVGVITEEVNIVLVSSQKR